MKRNASAKKPDVLPVTPPLVNPVHRKFEAQKASQQRNLQFHIFTELFDHPFKFLCETSKTIQVISYTWNIGKSGDGGEGFVWITYSDWLFIQRAHVPCFIC